MIPRISFGEAQECFQRDYFDLDLPVIITDFTQGWAANSKWTMGYLLEKFHDKPQLVEKTWFVMDNTFLCEDYTTPPFIQNIQDRRDISRPKHDMRVWANANQHTTPFHYDGHQQYVFNVQVRGKKSWTLLDPQSYIQYYTCSNFPLERYNHLSPDQLAAEDITAYTFDLHAGEMLFIPAFWAHKVCASGEENVNLNWIGSKVHTSANPQQAREHEILKMLLILHKFKPFRPLIDRYVGIESDGYLESYAGLGLDFVKQVTQKISHRTALIRLFQEIRTLSQVRRDYPKLKAYEKAPLQQIQQAVG
ncbi:MAG: cupin-like domain-containing protein [Zetaproteobacteria bacterium]|nr:cupin-like domain-containing protein [Zetaproteobacteria bacterium]